MKFATFLAYQALHNNNKVAAVCGAQNITFRQLEEHSNVLAHWLVGKGVEVGDRVALYLPNCIEFLVAFFAIVKAGAVAVPINLRLAQPEVEFIHRDTSPALAFVAEELMDKYSDLEAAPKLRVAVGEVSADRSIHYRNIVQEGVSERPPLLARENNDCMISYTSGTTGYPKGAVLTQSNFIIMNGYLNALYWHYNQDDRILITTPLAHRTAFARMGNMLVLGATLVVLPRFSVQEVSETIKKYGITVLGLVPTIARLLIPEIKKHPENYTSLQKVSATGEAFPVALKRELLDLLPHLQLYSFYSMTEAGVVTVLKPEEQFLYPDSVGRALPEVEIRLVGADGHDVPEGEVGEVWVRCGEPGSFLLMKGYFNRPEDNIESLRGGWFLTGDMGRRDENGYYYIVDRKKDMILSGGYNIYSKEIELALLAHSAVEQAAVIGVPDEVFGEAVAAFVVIKSNYQQPSKEELIEWCTNLIASYKKPKYIYFLDKLPENSTGKIQKNLLYKFHKK